jgi:hypothetical protein
VSECDREAWIMRRLWQTRLSRNKKCNINIYTVYIYLKNKCACDNQGIHAAHHHYVIILHAHIFIFLVFSSEEVVKAVIKNTDVLIFIIVNYRKYTGNYVVFTKLIA